MAWDRLPL